MTPSNDKRARDVQTSLLESDQTMMPGIVGQLPETSILPELSAQVSLPEAKMKKNVLFIV